MHRLARPGDALNPPDVHVEAAIAVVEQLSLLNARRNIVLPSLKPIDSSELVNH